MVFDQASMKLSFNITSSSKTGTYKLIFTLIDDIGSRGNYELNIKLQD